MRAMGAIVAATLRQAPSTARRCISWLPGIAGYALPERGLLTPFACAGVGHLLPLGSAGAGADWRC